MPHHPYHRGSNEPPETFFQHREASNTAYNHLVDVVVEAGPTPQVQRQVQAALDEMQRLEAVMSRFDPHSQVSRINALAGRGTAVPVTRDLMRVLVQAQALAQDAPALMIACGLALAGFMVHAGRCLRRRQRRRSARR